MSRTVTPARPLDPTTRFVRSLEGGPFFKLSEAAEQIGVSDQVLRRLMKDPPHLGSSYFANFGKTSVYLYTRDDIEKIRAFLKERSRVQARTGRPSHRGAPTKFSAQQRKIRQRLYSSRHYYRRRREEVLAAGGDVSKVDARLDRIARRLEEMSNQS